MASLLPCNAQVFTPDANFWPRWRAEKREMKSNGYAVCKIKNQWYVIKVGGQSTLKLETKKLQNGSPDEVSESCSL